MFCPKCAAQNVDDASFCRVCGANIGLVPQALTGRLPEAAAPPVAISYRGWRGRRNCNQEPPTLERGIVLISMAVGFILAALAVTLWVPDGILWGWSLFLPGFGCLGKGVAAIVASRRRDKQLAGPVERSNSLNSQPANPAIRTARATGEMVQRPPSVTEGTTRHLGAEMPTRHLDS
jgi:hypothetical protein